MRLHPILEMERVTASQRARIPEEFAGKREASAHHLRLIGRYEEGRISGPDLVNRAIALWSYALYMCRIDPTVSLEKR